MTIAKEPVQQHAPGSVLAEIQEAIARLTRVSAVSARDELRDTAYPLLQMTAEQVGMVLAQHEQVIQSLAEGLDQAQIAIAELATAGDSVLLVDLATQIDDVLQLGLQLAALAAKGDDASRALASKYRKATEALRAELERVTVADDEDLYDDEDEDGDDDEDGDAEGADDSDSDDDDTTRP